MRRIIEWEWETYRRLLVMSALAVALAGVVGTYVSAQSTNVNFPVLHQDMSQWGGTSVSAAQALSDTMSNPTSPQTAANGLIWDTSQWVRRKAAAITTFPASTTTTSRNIVGAAISEKSSRWAVIHNPSAGTQASASIAAESSVRHVVDCVSFSGAATTNPSATALTINLRDGATGAGTIIWTYQVVALAATGNLVPAHSICGLNLVGTTNTAMTFEFSALLANLIESVSISGYNVS